MTEYSAVDTTEDAVHLIETLPGPDGDTPYFLVVAYNLAHLPMTRPVQRPDETLCVGSAGTTVQGEVACEFDGQDLATQDRCLVKWLDNEIGRIVCAVESGGHSALPTTIVFLGDNGTYSETTVAPFIANHAKGSLFDGGINVPFIVKSPLVHPALVGGSTDALVSATDILRTAAELAGAPVPPDPYGIRDSISFLPVLAGISGGDREYLFSEMFRPNFVPDRAGDPPAGYVATYHGRAIRDREGFKLIVEISRDSSGGVGKIKRRLFYLPRDPHECRDFIPEARQGIEPFAGAFARLATELEQRCPSLVGK